MLTEPPFPPHSLLGDPGPVLGLITPHTAMTQPGLPSPPSSRAKHPTATPQRMSQKHLSFTSQTPHPALPNAGSLAEWTHHHSSCSARETSQRPLCQLPLPRPHFQPPPSPPDPASSTGTRTVHSVHHGCPSPSSRLRGLFTWAPPEPPSWPSCFLPLWLSCTLPFTPWPESSFPNVQLTMSLIPQGKSLWWLPAQAQRECFFS